MNFIPNFIVSVEIFEHHSISEIQSIIYKKGECFYVLVESTEKVEDVSKMPNYIQDDWVKHNSRELTLLDIDFLIKRFTISRGDFDYLNDKKPELIDHYEEKLSLLKNIKRELKIKNLLS